MGRFEREFAALVADAAREAALDAISPGGDPTWAGLPAPVGAHVTCLRVSDYETRCGVVDENRAGLFLTCCDGTRAVLTASLWHVRETPRCVPG
ncbi:hypothetical protein ACIQGZ_17185 [Streptomyces sp. NPDC092296]|uniref:hypothetical protein n=1 Tax=Streptomyces sp. NPDC092296 TaxID=3366012 RepID=UPI00382E16D7